MAQAPGAAAAGELGRAAAEDNPSVINVPLGEDGGGDFQGDLLMRILCLCALAGLLFPSAVLAQPGEDEVQKLKVEVAKLHEENAQLKKELDRLSSPAAKFEQVLWLQTKDDKKGTLYLVIPVTGGGLRKQMEALGPYAAAA